MTSRNARTQRTPNGMPPEHNGIITVLYPGYLPPVVVVLVNTEMFDQVGNGRI